MRDDVLTGGFETPPVQSARAFRAALSALARPGRIEEIEGGVAPAPVSPAAATLLLTLCDGETPIFLAPGHDTEALRDWIAFHIGAPIVAPAQAMFALGRWEALQPLSAFPLGSSEYPDRSATLIVEMDELTAQGARLTGPGIETEARLSLPEVAAFQANRAGFPLGLDFFFTCDNRLAALPRSTKVEAG
ncbi:MAG TPA: phosphonate C-P lyase system protein PhnH [Rhodobacterales bacterium]|nr:phosphonate C-P lyase system protein PhnH [Rhodobacterales bacterium]